MLDAVWAQQISKDANMAHKVKMNMLVYMGGLSNPQQC